MDYGLPVRFGVFLTPQAGRADQIIDTARLIDELGFDLIGIQDHPYQRLFFDTWTLLAAIAMRTERVTVFPDVANLPLRPPAMLAKAAASLDVLTGGRVELGLGAGSAWEAIKAIGGTARTAGESVEALEEAIQVIRLMWSGGHGLRFQGRHYHLAGVHSGPVPVHPMGIWLGAYKPRMLALVGRLADGWVPSLGYVTPADLIAGNRRIDDAARQAGRDPKSIRRILNSWLPETADPVETLARLALEHGMDTFIVGEGDDEGEYLRHFATDIAPRVRQRVAEGRGPS